MSLDNHCFWKPTTLDVDDQKLVIRNPKSGKEAEVVFIPKKLADRLMYYARDKGIQADQRIFPITYTAARVMVKKAGALVGGHLRPHDLRRHAATAVSSTSAARFPLKMLKLKKPYFLRPSRMKVNLI